MRLHGICLLSINDGEEFEGAPQIEVIYIS